MEKAATMFSDLGRVRKENVKTASHFHFWPMNILNCCLIMLALPKAVIFTIACHWICHLVLAPLLESDAGHFFFNDNNNRVDNNNNNDNNNNGDDNDNNNTSNTRENDQQHR